MEQQNNAGNLNVSAGVLPMDNGSTLNGTYGEKILSWLIVN